MEEAEVLCDRLAIMDHGKILEMGTVDELDRQALPGARGPVRPARGTAATPTSAALPGVTEVMGDATEVLLYTTDVGRTIGALLAMTDARGVEPQNLAIRRATLEDVFLDLTGRALRD